MKSIILATLMSFGLSYQVAFAHAGSGSGGGDYGGGYNNDYDNDYDNNYPGNWDYGDSYGGGQVTCSAGDAGWEEHWSGHSTCGECLGEHGSCVETCSQQYYSCTAEGTVTRGNMDSKSDFGASAADRWRAEDKALDRCWRSGASSCSIKNCNTQSETVSRKSC